MKTVQNKVRRVGSRNEDLVYKKIVQGAQNGFICVCCWKWKGLKLIRKVLSTWTESLRKVSFRETKIGTFESSNEANQTREGEYTPRSNNNQDVILESIVNMRAVPTTNKICDWNFVIER